MCAVSWSVRYRATSAATVMRLRSRFDRPGRSQMSPKSVASVSSTSLGAKSPITRWAGVCSGAIAARFHLYVLVENAGSLRAVAYDTIVATREGASVDIDEVIARAEIQNVLWTYARGVDRGDFEALAS